MPKPRSCRRCGIACWELAQEHGYEFMAANTPKTRLLPERRSSTGAAIIRNRPNLVHYSLDIAAVSSSPSKENGQTRRIDRAVPSELMYFGNLSRPLDIPPTRVDPFVAEDSSSLATHAVHRGSSVLLDSTSLVSCFDSWVLSSYRFIDRLAHRRCSDTASARGCSYGFTLPRVVSRIEKAGHAVRIRLLSSKENFRAWHADQPEFAPVLHTLSSTGD